MRVLQVDSGREWRGGQNQVRLLCRELRREPEVELQLATRWRSRLAQRAAADGVRVRGLPWLLSLDPISALRLRSVMAGFQPDIIHTHDSHALRLAVGAHKRTDWDRTPPPIVATRRVDFSVRPGQVKRLLVGPSPWTRITHVIAISDAVKAVLVDDGLSPREVTVVPSGIDPDEVRQNATRPLDIRRRLGLPPGTPLAANVAALVDHKDQRTLVRAAAQSRAAMPDLHWVIAGEGPLRGSLAAEIARLELRDRVHLLGYIEEADSLIREADVFVMSSREEGLGSVILNALALDKPVVATAGGGIPEILPADVLVPVGDADRLARKVVEVVAHPPSPRPLPARFTARAMAHGVLAVYRSLL
ncbi:MAG TPA: glycosyltransferase [Gemmatimonadales bacterium]